MHNGYMEKMQKNFDTSSSLSKDEDEKENQSVYVLDADKSVYDVRESEFAQVHCIRFEYERTMGFKITDIDFYLEGNRHSRAHSEELLSGKVV